MKDTTKTLADLIRRALTEDLGAAGDITSRAVVPAKAKATAVLKTRKPGVISGIAAAAEVFRTVDPKLRIKILVKDGAKVASGKTLMQISGSARSLLAAERSALNLLCHLSGVATQTRLYADAVKGTGAKITDTRKTLPGMRALQKAAVKAGGGHNHRFGLHDAVLIKDNHIAAARGVKSALTRARTAVGRRVRITIEVDTLDQLAQVLDHGDADMVLLDNMDTKTLCRAVALCRGKIVTEASGGVNLKTVRAIAQTGVDRIAVGALTHSAPALDIGLDFMDG